MPTAHRAVLRIALAALSATTFAQTLPTFDSGFQERAMTHVRTLASLGERVAGGKGESAAAAYIKTQMEKAGLRVTVEPFEFQSFALESVSLKAGDVSAAIVRAGFDPYAGRSPVTGELAFVESTEDVPALIKMDLDGKMVVTTANANPFLLVIFKQPGAVVVVSPEDLKRLQASGVRSGEIAYQGKVVTVRSANVVGVLRGGTGKETVLSAHYDSWKGPGANDNASGVAVLLELARYFHERKPAPSTPVRFVALGAEEMGLMGAKAYLKRHKAELQECRLLFNVDTVGGGGAIATETRKDDEKPPAHLAGPLPDELFTKGMNEVEGRWMLIGRALGTMFSPSTVTDSLRTVVADAGKDLGLEVRPVRGMGSDHRVFAQAGIVVTNTAVMGGNGTHTAADSPDAVNAKSLENVARLVAAVVDRYATASR